jgi:hypothetical protein
VAIDKEASRQWRKQLRDVLNTEWDPIGCNCPEDEYDSYGGKVAAMVRAGASDRELFDYLDRAETKNMGFAATATG